VEAVDLSPPHLEAGGQLAALGAELALEDREALGLLAARVAGVGAVEVGLDQGADPLVGGQRRG